MITFTSEASRILNFLASSPIGHTTTKADTVQEILLETNGNMLSQGRLYNIKADHIAAGVYKVYLELANP